MYHEFICHQIIFIPFSFFLGTMTHWKCVEMGRPEGESDFITILDCPEGKVYYKFNEDGVWKHDHKQPSVKQEGEGQHQHQEPGAEERAWNVMEANR